MACDNPTAAKFEEAAELTLNGSVFGAYYALNLTEVPMKERVAFWNLFEADRSWLDPDLREGFNRRNWRATAFCFAAAMMREGGLRA